MGLQREVTTKNSYDESLYPSSRLSHNDTTHGTRQDKAPAAATPPLSAKYFIHAASPTSPKMSPWTRSHLISTSYAPQWNDYKIVGGILELIKAALQDEEVTHVAVVTER